MAAKNHDSVKESYVNDYEKTFANIFSPVSSQRNKMLAHKRFMKKWYPLISNEYGYHVSRWDDIYGTASCFYNRFRFELENPGKPYKF